MGIIEKCSDQPRQSSDDTIHYLPHHAIICIDKQTTIALNDCLFSGPNFDLDILLRFRTYKIALIADIEKAFKLVDGICSGGGP